MIKTDSVFKFLTGFNAALVLVCLTALILVLGHASWPAFSHFGWRFLVTESWNPVTEIFGAAAPIYGTLMTSFLAMLVAVPMAFGIAYFLTEIAPPALARPIGIAVELLAGIPSIIYGMWGLFVLAPLFQKEIEPFLIAHLGALPFVGTLFAGPAYGIGILTASFVLAIMILPYIAAFMRDVFLTVPAVVKESAYALGATTSDVMSAIVLPSTRAGVMGGTMLGLGRALGETMAVTFIIGNAHRISGSLLATGTTISATIANEFNEAVGDLYTASILALGLILFLITFGVLAISRLLLLRLQRKAGV